MSLRRTSVALWASISLLGLVIVLFPILFHPCPSIPRALSRFQQLDFEAGLNFEAKYRYAFVELVAALDAIPLARVAQAAA